MRDVIKLCIYELKIQMLSKRVLLGYLVGISIMLKFAVGYIQDGDYIGEPINVLEPFIMVGNCDRIIMLLTVGWLLIMSGAPFVNKISFYALYRTKRKLWNEAMVIYIFVQALLYYAVIAVVLMLLGGMNGYLANIWSVPFIDVLSSGSDSYLYGVDFPSSDYADVQSVYMGFFHTFALQVLYAVIIGIFVYVISQMTNRMAGPIAAFILHFLGYEIMKEGYGIVITYSLLARSIPAFQLGKNALVNLGQSYLIFIVIIILLVELSGKLVNYMDFKNMAIQEGD